MIISAHRKNQPAKQLATYSSLSEHRITQLLGDYNEYGIKLFESIGEEGRKYGYLLIEEKKAFLKEFWQKAILGRITTAFIQAAFGERIGKKVAKNMVYRLLNRHGWQKVVLRSYHPKEDSQIKGVFKNPIRRMRGALEESTVLRIPGISIRSDLGWLDECCANIDDDTFVCSKMQRLLLSSGHMPLSK